MIVPESEWLEPYIEQRIRRKSRHRSVTSPSTHPSSRTRIFNPSSLVWAVTTTRLRAKDIAFWMMFASPCTSSGARFRAGIWPNAST